MKGYKLGMEDGKTGGGEYGSIECSVSMSNKSCSDYVKGYNAGKEHSCQESYDSQHIHIHCKVTVIEFSQNHGLRHVD
jgi:hypothetical protein